MNKVTDLEHVISYINDGTILMYGGFGGIGNPPTIIKGILEKGCKNLHLIGNDAGFPHIGIGQLFSENRVQSLIASHIGSNPVAGKLMNEKKLDVMFVPQGTLAERIRAAGVGLGGVLVDIGKDNMVAENKEIIEVNEKQYLIETALKADVSIVFAKKADTYGNLVFDKTARNISPQVAMAGDITIAEVEEIVEPGELNPEEIIVPGIFVDYIFKSEGVDWEWVWE